MRMHKECRVDPRMLSQPGTPICSISRCRSSAATLLNVTGIIRSGSAPCSNSLETHLLSANDLPVPGPATTRLKRVWDDAIPYAADFGSRSRSHGMQNTRVENDWLSGFAAILLSGFRVHPIDVLRYAGQTTRSKVRTC